MVSLKLESSAWRLGTTTSLDSRLMGRLRHRHLSVVAGRPPATRLSLCHPQPTRTSDPPSSLSAPSIALAAMATYHFPAHRLRHTLHDGSKTPIALVACGSFSPVTYLHLRMFEMARDYIRTQTNFEVIAAYMSPVNDDYKKPGLLSACSWSMPTPIPQYLLAYM